MTRDLRIDRAKGLAILLMILGHANIPSWLFHAIYTFHMPLFILLSGYFFKERTMKENLQREAGHLLCPYLYCSLIFLAIVSVHCVVDADFTWLKETALAVVYGNIGAIRQALFPASDVPGIGIIWFLPALFWCKMVYQGLYRLLKPGQQRFSWLLTLAVICIAWLAVALVEKKIYLPLNLLAGVSLLLFFHIGHIARQWEHSLTGVISQGSYRKWMLLACVLLWVLSLLEEQTLVVGGCEYGNLYLQTAGAYAATWLVVMGMGLFDRYFEYVGRLLAWCGNHSMTILCVNFLVMASGFVWYLPFAMTGTSVFITYCISTLLITWVIANYKKFIRIS